MTAPVPDPVAIALSGLPEQRATPLPRLDHALQPGVVRSTIVRLWDEVQAKRKYAGPTLSKGLRGARSLGSKDRRIASSVLYGMMRHQRVLAWSVERAGGRSDDGLTLVLAFLFLAEGAPIEAVAKAGPDLDWGLLSGVDGLVRDWAADRTAAEALGFAASLPAHVAGEWIEALGAESAAFVRSLMKRPPMAIRANSKRIDRDGLKARLESEGVPCRLGALAPHALVLQERTHVESLASFREGLFEVQDEGSQCLAELVGAFPGMKVVDFCAGAGGKSLALAAAGAEVWALDVRSNGLEELERRAFRNGVRVRTDRIRERGPLPVAPGWADVVLVDAPCSGTGVLRRHPEHRYRLSPDRIAQCGKDQATILTRAADLVAYPGQKLVYGTCSLLRAENDAVVDAFVERRPVFRRRSLLGENGWLWPHRDGTDGFYGVALERSS